MLYVFRDGNEIMMEVYRMDGDESICVGGCLGGLLMWDAYAGLLRERLIVPGRGRLGAMEY